MFVTAIRIPLLLVMVMASLVAGAAAGDPRTWERQRERHRKRRGRGRTAGRAGRAAANVDYGGDGCTGRVQHSGCASRRLLGDDFVRRLYHVDVDDCSHRRAADARSM